MRTVVGGDPARISQGAQHRIFVEGSSDEAIDPVVISELLRVNDLTEIAVRAMGHCDNVRSAAQALVRHHPSIGALANKVTAVATAASETEVIRRYADFVDELSGGAVPLAFGTGRWLERISGKEIFRSIAGAVFKVTARDGSVLQGKEQHHEIAKDLLRQPLAAQPADFQSLVSLLRERVR